MPQRRATLEYIRSRSGRDRAEVIGRMSSASVSAALL